MLTGIRERRSKALDKPLISIIIPIYNVERYLDECITSIIQQSYKDYEIILVDDGSPDNCPSICDSYSKQYSNIQVIHKLNGGLISARKVGVSMATGCYIVFLDGDDWISSTMLIDISTSIKEKDSDIIMYSFTKTAGQKKEVYPINLPCGYYNRQLIEKELLPYMMSNDPFYSFLIPPSVCIKAYKKELLENVMVNLPLNISLGEDAIITYPAIEKAKDLTVIECYGYMYRTNEESMTRKYNPGLIQSASTLIDYLGEWVDSSLYKSLFVPQLLDYACYIFLELFVNELRGGKKHEEVFESINRIITQYYFYNGIMKHIGERKVKIFFTTIKRRSIFLFYVLKSYYSKYK